MHLLKQHRLRSAPLLELEQARGRGRVRQAEARRQPHAMFVEHRADLLLEPGAFLHHALIRAEHLAPLQGFGVGRPDLGRQAAQVNARDLHRIHPVIGAIRLANLPGLVAVQNHGRATRRLQARGDGKGVGAGFEHEGVTFLGMAQRPGFELDKRHPGGGVLDFGRGRVAPAQDGAGEGIRLDIEADNSAGSTGSFAHGNGSFPCFGFSCSLWTKGAADAIRRILVQADIRGCVGV